MKKSTGKCRMFRRLFGVSLGTTVQSFRPVAIRHKNRNDTSSFLFLLFGNCPDFDISFLKHKKNSQIAESILS
jgi:hypothetical protein